jgi:hypothetical protein
VADTWMNQRLTHGIPLLVVEVPCGPVMGCHVAPCDWISTLCKIMGSPPESNPQPTSKLRTGRIGLTARSTGGSY